MAKHFAKESAAQFLTERFGTEAGQSAAELGGGDWSRAYSFTSEGQSLVARFGNYVEDFEKDRQAMRFASAYLPVPKILEIGEAPEGYYAISERYEGLFLESLSEEQWQRVLPALLRGLSTLREIPMGGGIDWADPTSHTGWHEWLLSSLIDTGEGRVSGWRSKLKQLPHCERIFVEGEDCLRSLLPFCPEIRHVIHRDLLNRNVLVSFDATQLEAVFDWGCSLAGDFVYEIAWFTFWSPWHPAIQSLNLHQSVPAHYADMGLEVENFEQRLSAYELQIGLEHIAYCAFSDRFADLEDVTQATEKVLQRLSEQHE